MSKINLIRTGMALPDGPALDGARDLLFKALDGFSPDDKKSWRRFWRHLMKLEPGEMAQAEMMFPRNSKFHRKFFALLNIGFDAWEPPRKRRTYKGMPVQKNFDQFREDVIISAGFYDQTFDLRGRMKVKAKSISFAKMDDVEFERVYSAVADVLLGGVLVGYASRDELDRVVDQIMGFV